MVEQQVEGAEDLELAQLREEVAAAEDLVQGLVQGAEDLELEEAEIVQQMVVEQQVGGRLELP